MHSVPVNRLSVVFSMTKSQVWNEKQLYEEISGKEEWSIEKGKIYYKL